MEDLSLRAKNKSRNLCDCGFGEKLFFSA